MTFTILNLGRPARAAAAALAVAATALFAGGTAEARGLTVAVQKLPDVLEPAMENSNVHLRVIYSIFDTLVKTDYRNGGQLKPALATDWEIESPRSIVFTLREDVTFHNGAKMTAEDVAWAFGPERLNTRAEGTGSGGTVVVRPFLGGIESVEVLDRHRLRITMAEDDALILQRFANYPAQIGSKAGFEAAGSWTEWAKQPVGTGPYEVAEFVFGERLVLRPFEGYWGESKAAAEEVTFVVVPEIATRIAGLRSGQFDIITEVGPDHIAEIEQAQGVGIVGGSILNIRGLIYDSAGEGNPMADPRVRQALNLAIDRQAIVDSLYDGKTEVTRGWQMEVFGDMYLADRPKSVYDVAQAKALLQEAGYDGEEIVYRSQQGYYTNQGQTAQILVSMWKQAGLNVRLDMVENWDQIYEDTADRGIFDGSFTAYYPDPVGQIWRRFGPKGSWVQRGIYDLDESFVELGTELETNPDVQARREVFAQMLDAFKENPHGTPLHALTQFYGVRDDVDWTPYPTQYMNLTDAELSFAE
ncbi:ABC transporter substrate-binding protein [Algihabitans albus]|uniref:ABC transporter substrate-binding protein n=1 Tax=Algihabitans albus TaxID=2164067 RepID=UPI000E5D836C|nr:ABC transporter substrate-binding protein [Algihabitans albus]